MSNTIPGLTTAEVVAIADGAEAEPVRLAGGAAEILAEELTPGIQHRVGVAIEGCTYTTTVLRAMAAFIRLSFDDEAGAAMLERFAAEFAAHEASQI